MQNWERALIVPDIPIIQAIKIIDESAAQIGLVVDNQGKLIGTVTDGDIRRAILKQVELSSPVSSIMNIKPRTASPADSKEHILYIMQSHKIRQVPLVGNGNIILGLALWDELLESERHDNWIVIMAGGLGSRLGELTTNCPKPLLSVGGKPLLERIVENFKECGFHNFYFAVNYKAEMIEKYFGCGSKWNVNICYLKEKDRLGTAGALSLMPNKPKGSIIIMNGDLLTKVNFQQLLDFHLQQQALATMCVREYSLQIPYGVVDIVNNKLKTIREKPLHNYFVSAGIYVIEPTVLDLIPQNEYLDMPTLFDKILHQKQSVNVFPIREYWIDIGRRDDLERANYECGEVFGC